MRILVTAGPTREPIDPVRFISNRSSGKMGYAIAAEALRRGHEVRLVSGPVHLPSPEGGASVIRVCTADDMLGAVMGNLDWCQVLIMAAAVADWRPAEAYPRKMKKADMPRVLRLEPAPDILRTIRDRKGDRLFIGFAAETGNTVPEAKRKLADKGLDLIVANDVLQPGAGFDTDTNQVTLLSPGGTVLPLPLMSKAAVAHRLLDWVEQKAMCRGQKKRDPSSSKAI